MQHARHYLSLIILAFVLAGCQSLGLEAPKTFEEKLAYGYSTNAAVRKSAADALTAKTITVSDAKQVLATTDTARAALDEARALACPAALPLGSASLGSACLDAGSLPSTALGKLQMATSLLTALQTFLQSKGAK